MTSTTADNRGRRESGAALLMVMIVSIAIFGLTAMMTITSLATVRAASESERSLRALYIADSGAQTGIAKAAMAVASNNTSSCLGTYVEAIGGGSAAVVIEEETTTVLRVASTGSYGEQQCTVEVYVSIESSFRLPGALTTMFGQGVEVKAPSVATAILGSSSLNGFDHSPTGTLLRNQTRAVAGLAMNSIPGKKSFGVTYEGGGPGVVGNPPANCTASDCSASLLSIRDYALANADVKFLGSRTLGTKDRGSFGTPTKPALVYGRLEDNGCLNLTESFLGCGTLVLESARADSHHVLSMTNLSQWRGVIIIYLTGPAEANNQALVRLSGDAKVIGAVAFFLDGLASKVDGFGKFYQGTDRATIMYSSSVVSSAPGVNSKLTTRVLAYRIP